VIIELKATDEWGIFMKQDLQLVIFSLDKEYFGLATERVTEISRLETITQIPRSAPHIAGVINLRGQITPVICLREKFGLPPRVNSKETRIVFTEVSGIPVGLIVDAVLEVGELQDSLVTAAPEATKAQHLLGICHYKQQNPERLARVIFDSFVQQESNALGRRLQQLQGYVKSLVDYPGLIYAEKEVLIAELYKKRGQMRAIENIALTDLVGISEVNTANKRLDLSKRKYVHASLRGSPAYEFVVSAVDGGIILAVSEPVRDSHGTISGVILLTTDISKDPSLEFAPFGKTGERYLVDRDGNFITKSRFLENVVLLKRKASAPAGDLFLANALPSFFGKYSNYRGQEVYGAMSYLEGLDVVVVVEQETQEMNGEVLVAMLDTDKLFAEELFGN